MQRLKDIVGWEESGNFRCGSGCSGKGVGGRGARSRREVVSVEGYAGERNDEEVDARRIEFPQDGTDRGGREGGLVAWCSCRKVEEFD